MTYDTFLDVILHIILSLRSYNNCPVFSSGAPFFAWFRKEASAKREWLLTKRRFLLPALIRRKFSSSETSRYEACYHQNHHEHHSIFDHQYQISFSAGECWAGHKSTHNYRALGKANIGECIGDDYQPCGAYDRYCMGKTFTNMVYELGKLSINGEPKPIPNDRYFGFPRKYWCWTVLQPLHHSRIVFFDLEAVITKLAAKVSLFRP